VGVLLHAFVFVMLSKFVMRRFAGYMPGSLAPGMLGGGSSSTGSYMALAPHGHKQK
jgi:hypothetical protein